MPNTDLSVTYLIVVTSKCPVSVIYKIETVSRYGASAHLYGLLAHFEALGLPIRDKVREDLWFSIMGMTYRAVLDTGDYPFEEYDPEVSGDSSFRHRADSHI